MAENDSLSDFFDALPAALVPGSAEMHGFGFPDDIPLSDANILTSFMVFDALISVGALEPRDIDFIVGGNFDAFGNDNNLNLSLTDRQLLEFNFRLELARTYLGLDDNGTPDQQRIDTVLASFNDWLEDGTRTVPFPDFLFNPDQNPQLNALLEDAAIFTTIADVAMESVTFGSDTSRDILINLYHNPDTTRDWSVEEQAQFDVMVQTLQSNRTALAAIEGVSTADVDDAIALFTAVRDGNYANFPALEPMLQIPADAGEVEVFAAMEIMLYNIENQDLGVPLNAEILSLLWQGTMVDGRPLVTGGPQAGFSLVQIAQSAYVDAYNAGTQPIIPDIPISPALLSSTDLTIPEPRTDSAAIAQAYDDIRASITEGLSGRHAQIALTIIDQIEAGGAYGGIRFDPAVNPRYAVTTDVDVFALVKSTFAEMGEQRLLFGSLERGGIVRNAILMTEAASLTRDLRLSTSEEQRLFVQDSIQGRLMSTPEGVVLSDIPIQDADGTLSRQSTTLSTAENDIISELLGRYTNGEQQQALIDEVVTTFQTFLDYDVDPTAGDRAFGSRSVFVNIHGDNPETTEIETFYEDRLSLSDALVVLGQGQAAGYDEEEEIVGDAVAVVQALGALGLSVEEIANDIDVTPGTAPDIRTAIQSALGAGGRILD